MQLILLPDSEVTRRIEKVRGAMASAGLDAVLIADNANLYYLTGRVFAGYAYIPAKGDPLYFVRRPVRMEGCGVIPVRKPEQIAESVGADTPSSLGLELDTIPYSLVGRLSAIFTDTKIGNASSVMRQARAVKTPEELKKIETSGIRQTHVYSMIPSLFHEGMTDIELQIEIEKASRLEGCLGQFRIAGNSMELYMANLLSGDNADNPTPYDFAMGGEGLDPSLPVGCNGSVIRRGETVMADINGNFTGYMTDMTRCFAQMENLPQRALEAHQTSIDICDTLADMGRPGVEARTLYEKALAMARDSGFESEFMGHRQQAGFVGHGLGIEINELPVIAPRSKSVLQAGNVIALEPKFVIPGVGAVGIENTYIVKTDGPMECVTNAPKQIIYFE